tara:strand:+ start:401 stop:850 length:450 start_codon:yes stop_codon:yes gene_type:complete
MAIAITNLRGNCLIVARNLDDLNLVLPHHGLYDSTAGQKHEISDSEFDQVRFREKILTFDGTSLNYADSNFSMENEEDLTAHIADQKKVLDNILEAPRFGEGTLKTDAQNYRTALDNLDISSVTYPFTKTLERHMSDLGHTVVSSLQYK